MEVFCDIPSKRDTNEPNLSHLLFYGQTSPCLLLKRLSLERRVHQVLQECLHNEGKGYWGQHRIEIEPRLASFRNSFTYIVRSAVSLFDQQTLPDANAVICVLSLPDCISEDYYHWGWGGREKQNLLADHLKKKKETQGIWSVLLEKNCLFGAKIFENM